MESEGIRLKVCLALLLALAAIALAVTFMRDRNIVASSNANESAMDRFSSLELPSRYSLEPGMELDYDVSLSQNATISAASTGIADSTIPDSLFQSRAMNVEGCLRICVFSVENETCWCVADFPQIETEESKSDLLDFSELKEPVVFHVSFRGELGLIYPPKSISSATIRFWQSSLPLIFLRLPERMENAWERSYSDLTGTYDAGHVMAGPGLVRVKKLRYRSLSGVPRTEVGEDGMFSMENLIHEQVYRFDLKQAVIDYASIRENGEFTLFRRLKIRGEQKGAFQLQRIQIVDEGDLLSKIVKSFGTADISKIAESESGYRMDEVIFEKTILPTAIGPDQSVPQILAAYGALRAGDDKERNKLFGKLVEVVRARPEAVAEVGKRISDCKDDRRLRRWLLDGLAYSGSVAGCAALAAFVRDENPDLASQAVMASGFVRRPSPELIGAVIERVANRRELDPMTAQTVLSVAGAFVSRLEHDLVSRDRLVDILRAEGPSISEEGLLKAYFSAWANTQLPEAKERILERVPPDSSDSLWMGAVFALEHLRHQGAREALIELANDPSRSSSLRDRAVRALANQDLLPDDRVSRVISDWFAKPASDWSTAHSALMYLRRAATRADGAALTLLQRIANTQGNEKSRDLARRLIQQIGGDSHRQ